MREPEYINDIITPVNNKVLVQVADTYSTKQRKSGTLLANAAHEDATSDSDGYKLSEFIIRTGKIARMPRTVSPVYDWYPVDEFKEGDKVYWPIVKFFDYPVLKTLDGRMFMLIDYFDIHLKEVEGKPVPVNGFYLFEQETKGRDIFEYHVEESTNWYKIVAIGKEIKYVNDILNYKSDWVVGDVVYLNVPPFKLEADTAEEFDKQYFLAQKRHILISR